MSRSKIDIEKSLRKKGFQTKENDHKYFIYYSSLGKKTTVITKTSHGSSNQDLSDNLLSLMAKQCKIDKLGFLSLNDCDMSQVDYEKLLVVLGLIN